MAAGQLGFHVDMQRCTGCRTCTIACKDKHDLPVGQNFRRVIEVSGGSWTEDSGGTAVPSIFAYYISTACNHCAEPRCAANCPTGAMAKRPADGVVAVDPRRCIGCQYCAWSCPYGAPQFDSSSGRTRKCDLCADLREQGLEPACVTACPSRAISWGPVAELKQNFCGATTALHGLPDPAATQPSGLYTPHRHAGRRLRP